MGSEYAAANAAWKEKPFALTGRDVPNDSMLPFFKAAPPAEVRSLDAEIDSLAPDFLARVESDGKPVRLDRGKHREHHVAQIEKALGL